jgi:cytoskeletal protein RodZ
MKLTKKTWIIIAAVAVVGVAGFIIWKKKKAAAMEAGESTGEPGEEKAPETAKAGASKAPAATPKAPEAEKATTTGVPVSSALAAKLQTPPGTVLKSQVPIKTTAAPVIAPTVTKYTAPTTSKIVTPTAPVPVKTTAPAPVKTTAPVPVKTTAPAPVKTTAPAPVTTPTGTGGTFSNAVLESTRKQTILHVKPKKLFTKGSKIKVTGKLYNGVFNVWNVYTGNATLDAVYIDTPFKGVDTGTVTKV